MPIFAGGGLGGARMLLAAPEVAAIRLSDGPTVRSVGGAALPFGLRAAAYRATTLAEGSGALVALNAAGHVISTGSAGVADSPTLRWETPGAAPWFSGAISSESGNVWIGRVRSAQPRGACSIEGGPGLQPLAGAVVTAAVANPGILGRGFLACADAAFEVGGVQMIASVVLDARDPGARPARLPRTTQVRGHPGVVEEQPIGPSGGPLLFSDGYDGGLAARRVGDAWLVVQSTGSATQRIAVLSRLHIGPIDARTQPVPADGPSGEQYAIVQRPLAGLREATQIAPEPPPCLTLCTEATFFIGDWTLHAHVWLVDSVGHGRGLAPARLRAVPHVADTYIAYAPRGTFDGVWHRIGKAWLTVEDGRSVAQDITVSEALTVRTGPG